MWLGSQVVRWPDGHLARYLVPKWLGGQVVMWPVGYVVRW